MYCQNCGSKINEDAKFCTKCGFKVSLSEPESLKSATTHKEQQSKLNSEPVLDKESLAFMVLNVNKKEGLLKRTNAFLVFFKDRLVLAELTSERQKAESKMMSQKIKEEGTGFFKGSAAMMSYWSNYGNKYYQMTPSDILREEPTNIEIDHSTISKFVFSRMETKSYSDNNTNSSTGGGLEIQYANRKIAASHNYSDNNQNIKKILENLYGNKLKYKGTKVIFNFGNKDGFI
ncbi:MAG: zinc ribbon domain-containing protein [Dethiosulfatibacter sp.]|nr:zinc ribbon domain-containing protein [Dethiosulfatibacter sp.]